MWLTRLCYGAIRGAGSITASPAVISTASLRPGLCHKGMDMMFEYNINQALLHVGLPARDLTRQETIALEHIGNMCVVFDAPTSPNHTIRINVNSRESYESQSYWNSGESRQRNSSAVKVGDEIPATLDRDGNHGIQPAPSYAHTLQMDAFNNLGFTPRKTTRVAEKLYSKGLISSPMTSCSHPPEKLRGHLQTVFGETNGYPVG